MPCDHCTQTLAAVLRVEAMVSQLVKALAEEEDDEVPSDLDGRPAGQPREEGQAL